MKVVSFDVGIINLAYCIFDSLSRKISYWEVVTLPESQNYSRLYINLINELDKRPFLLEGDIVVIEKQPSFNPKMRIIAGCLQTYFFIRGIVDKPQGTIKGVEFFSPKHKLKCYSGPDLVVSGKSKYLQTKKKGIVIARSKLEEYNETQHFKNIFENATKRDDLSDCYLQAITYCLFKKQIPVSLNNQVTSPNRVTKVQLKREISDYLEAHDTNTLQHINNAPSELQTMIATKYTVIFPLTIENLQHVFGDLSLKRRIIL